MISPFRFFEFGVRRRKPNEKIYQPAVPRFSRSSLIDECSRDVNKNQPVSPLFHQVFEGGLVVESIPSRFLCNLDEGLREFPDDSDDV